MQCVNALALAVAHSTPSAGIMALVVECDLAELNNCGHSIACFGQGSSSVASHSLPQSLMAMSTE